MIWPLPKIWWANSLIHNTKMNLKHPWAKNNENIPNPNNLNGVQWSTLLISLQHFVFTNNVVRFLLCKKIICAFIFKQSEFLFRKVQQTNFIVLNANQIYLEHANAVLFLFLYLPFPFLRSFISSWLLTNWSSSVLNFKNIRSCWQK